MKTTRRNLGQPEDYSKKDILEGLLYIASEMGAFKSPDQVNAEIEKAELAAADRPAPDRAAFKAKILKHIEKRDSERNQGDIISDVNFDQAPLIAMAARKRKRPSPKKSKGNQDNHNKDASPGS